MIAAIKNLFYPARARTGRGPVALMLVVLAALPACTGVNTFPTVARAGDTVSVMIGGSERTGKQTINATLTDANGQAWDLKAMGLVRSVFNLRAEGTAYGMHYSPFLDSYMPWFNGHEPLQTVLVTNIPANAAVGRATLTITRNATDDSSGIAEPFSVNLDVVPGSGVADSFLRQNSAGSDQAVDFTRLEPAPNAKISFGDSGTATIIGAVSLTVSFNSAVLNGNDINVYVPESAVRGSVGSTGAFGATQRMVYWRQDGQRLYIDVMAPQGIDARYLKLYIVHPRGLSASPGFSLVSASIYNTSGNAITLQPGLQYYP